MPRCVRVERRGSKKRGKRVEEASLISKEEERSVIEHPACQIGIKQEFRQE